MRTEGVGLRARPFLERPGGRRVVTMSMSHQNMRHAPAAERLFERVDVLGHIGTRVDHGDILRAQNVDAGSLEGERSGIAGKNAVDQRTDPYALAVGRVKISLEGNPHQACARSERCFASRSSASGLVRPTIVFTELGARRLSVSMTRETRPKR